MHDLQRILNAFSEGDRRTRSKYHVTLGEMIDRLSAADPAALVTLTGANTGVPGQTMSYRGFYADLSFEPESGHLAVADFLAVCKHALGASFGGYKGGDFTMGPDTPLWVAPYSCCGNAIVSAEQVDGVFDIETKDVG